MRTSGLALFVDCEALSALTIAYPKSATRNWVTCLKTLRNRFYYAVKPWMPQRFRLALRRWYTRRLRSKVANVWPILPGSEVPPANWRGWPFGKQFALILTHDVEGPSGVSRCRRLMELEKALGFRSSFNFIPEGPYRVSKALRDELTGNGFEVGVHDLHHDGKLYDSHEGFLRKAERINQYLREWDAVGFRSGFMFHNLEWAHQLDVHYEASTFDTDPFEPQPDGAGTIFPFWVPNKSAAPRRRLPAGYGDGYAELPYTLEQDSTLFLLLEERTPEIWIKKLDWIAQHGGMALLNVHPDYMAMDGATPASNEYPVEYYLDLLKHVSRHHEGRYLNALPKEIAAFVSHREHQSARSVTGSETQIAASPATLPEPATQKDLSRNQA